MLNNKNLKNFINSIPRELATLIFSFTDEFCRRYSRHLGFKMFGSNDNTIFPKGFLKIAQYLDQKSAHKLWKMERKIYCIVKEKQKFGSEERYPWTQDS